MLTEKAELVKKKLFPIPTIDGVQLTLADPLKNLGVILNPAQLLEN